MPTTSTLLGFALASLLLALAPGPSIVLLLAVGTERGRRAAALTALGLGLGTATWAAVTAAGLGALFAARPGLLRSVTALGGAYLVWLAVRSLRGRGDDRDDRGDRGDGHDEAASATPHEGLGARGTGDGPVRGPVVDGAVVNLLNPSLALFLAALLPPFVDPGAGPAWRQVLVLGAVLTAVSTVVNLGWGLAGAEVGGRLRAAVGNRRAAVGVAAAYLGLALFALWTALG